MVQIAELIAPAKPRPRFGSEYTLPIIFAGNKDAAPLVQKVVDRHRAAGVDVSNEVLDGTHLMIRDERWSEVAAHIQRWLDADLPAHASRA